MIDPEVTEPASIACARVIVSELLGAGMTDAVLAPGSRCAPLSYVLDAADRAGRLRLHVRIDERTAGYLALGLAKGTERPVAVVTTSGTAAANLHPAVLEAAHSGVPLVAVTADRPPALTHTGANQTTDQRRLFSDHVRGSGQLDDRADEATWRHEVRRLLALACGLRSRHPGPVQVDVALGDPLAPAGPLDPPGAAEPRPVARSRPADPTVLAAGPRTVFVAGDAPPAVGRTVSRLADCAGVPVLAEPSSNARQGAAAVRTYRLLLGTALAADIQRVVVFGHPTLSRPVSALLARSDVELVVVTDRADWIDPGLRRPTVCDAVDLEPGDPAWPARWRDADERLGRLLDDLLARQPVLTGPAVAGRVWTALDGGGPLLVGSSNPVRDLDLAPLRPQPPDVYANRGLAGIDGTISTATGIGLGTAAPTTALLGDLTFLHDLTGLVVGPDESRPDLRLLLVNDNGSSIFATLEHGRPELAGTYERVFGTPHEVDLGRLATGLGARHVRVGDLEALGEALAEPPRGTEVVEVTVDRAGRRGLDTEITALAARL